jgi:hypothetical protein
VQRISLLNTSVTSGTFRVGTSATGPWTTCLAHNVNEKVLKTAIDAIDPALGWDVTVKYNATDYINGGLNQARTWFVTFDKSLAESISFQVDQSVASGCTSFLPAIPNDQQQQKRLQMVQYVVGAHNDWSNTGAPTVLVENTASKETTRVITELAASTVHAFVVAGINAVGTGSYGTRSSNATTLPPKVPDQVNPAPIATNASSNGISLSWEAPPGNGLAITGTNRCFRWLCFVCRIVRL